MTLKRKILFMFAIFVFLTFTGSWIIFREFVKEQLTTQSINDLANFAIILGRQYENSGLELFGKYIKNDDELRVTFIDSSGKVLFDSEENAQKMDNHFNRPEVRAALHQLPEKEVPCDTAIL